MTGKTFLDHSLTLRSASSIDVNAVSKLNHDVAEMEGDSLFVLTAEELANEWKNEGFNVERDVFVVETRDGRLVGSEESITRVVTINLKQMDVFIQNSEGWVLVHPYLKK